MRPAPILALAVGVGLASCSGEPDPPHGGHEEEPPPAAAAPNHVAVDTPAEEEPAAADPAAPFDVRLVRVQPGQHIGSEQLCDVSFTGRVAPVEGRDARRYSEPATTRMSLKCRAATGEGWADLVFDEASASRAPEVTRNTRIRVKVLAAGGGFADYPVLKFVDVVGEAPPAPRSNALFANVQAGYDFARVAQDPSAVGSEKSCGVAFVGHIDIIEDDDRRRRDYPEHAQNRVVVKCKHSQGEEWVDLVFTPDNAMAALQIERGTVIRVRVVNAHGGFADYPVVSWVSGGSG